MRTETFAGIVQAKSSKAILVNFGNVLAWIPLSQINDCDCDLDTVRIGEKIEIDMPIWLAEQKELI